MRLRAIVELSIRRRIIVLEDSGRFYFHLEADIAEITEERILDDDLRYHLIFNSKGIKAIPRLPPG